MKTIRFEKPGRFEYDMIICDRLEQASDALHSFTHERKTLLLTDRNVAGIYSDKVLNMFKESGDVYLYEIESGEHSKCLEQLGEILAFMLKNNFSRGDVLVEFGGGVVGDLGGFAAAVFMRGIRHICIPTTLLSMCDSSIGGKTGIDILGVKNAAGAFHQPSLVVAATEFLKTLEDRDIRSGLGEVIKYCAISGRDLLKGYVSSGSIDTDTIIACAEIKREHVLLDEHDNSMRRILNLGHTFGHAFEAASDFMLSHGEAVALGLIEEARFGEMLGVTSSGTADRLRAMIRSAGLNAETEPFKDKAARFLIHDKKSTGEAIEFAFIKHFGEPLLYKVETKRAVDFLTDGTKS